MNQTGTHLVRRIVCPRNPTLCSGTGPGCPPSTAAWRSSSCPYRASSASSFRSFLECKCDFNEQWTIVTRANYISLLLLGASCSLNTTPCISPPHVAWNSEVFTKHLRKHQVTAQHRLSNSPHISIDISCCWMVDGGW